MRIHSLLIVFLGVAEATQLAVNLSEKTPADPWAETLAQGAESIPPEHAATETLWNRDFDFTNDVGEESDDDDMNAKENEGMGLQRSGAIRIPNKNKQKKPEAKASPATTTETGRFVCRNDPQKPGYAVSAKSISEKLPAPVGCFMKKKRHILFRGDTRPPKEIFATGFRPQGENKDMTAHLSHATDFKSFYISTTTAFDTALKYAFPPSSSQASDSKSYIYILSAQHLQDGCWMPSLYNAVKNPSIGSNQEFAVPGDIVPGAIIGVLKIKKSQYDKYRKRAGTTIGKLKSKVCFMPGQFKYNPDRAKRSVEDEESGWLELSNIFTTDLISDDDNHDAGVDKIDETQYTNDMLQEPTGSDFEHEEELPKDGEVTDESDQSLKRRRLLAQRRKRSRRATIQMEKRNYESYHVQRQRDL